MENNYWYLVNGCKGDCDLEAVGMFEELASETHVRYNVIQIEKCKKCGLHYRKQVGISSYGSSA